MSHHSVVAARIMAVSQWDALQAKFTSASATVRVIIDSADHVLSTKLSETEYAKTHQGIWPPRGMYPDVDELCDTMDTYLSLNSELYDTEAALSSIVKVGD
jgi:hypothetical protein